MTLSGADRAAIERLTDAMSALAAAISERNKQLSVANRVEMRSITLLTELLEFKRTRQPTAKKRP